MVKQIETIVWDFDGTQADTLEIITKIGKKLAKKYLEKDLGQEDIESFRGLDAKQIVKTLFRETNTNEKEKQDRYKIIPTLKMHMHLLFSLPKMLNEGSREFHEHRDTIEPYDGIVDIIKSLSRQDYENITLTSNRKETVHQIYQRWNLKCMEVYHCTSFLGFPSLFGKTECLKTIIKERGGRNHRYKSHSEPFRVQSGIWSYDSSKLLCIADEARDVHASRRLNIPIFGVTWGLNNETALINAGLSPEYLVRDPKQIPKKIEQLEREELGPCYKF